MDKPINNNDTTIKTNPLCWECARACGGANCPWADNLKPVKGWVLAPEDSSKAKGLSVLYCPMFFKGRNLSCMTPGEIESRSTNTTTSKVSRLYTRYIKDDKGAIIDKILECPVCGAEYDNRVSSCKSCKVEFLYDKSSNYALSYSNAQVRGQFFQEHMEDFPNSKYIIEED